MKTFRQYLKETLAQDIGKSFDKAGQEIDQENKRVSKKMNTLPDGYQITVRKKTWTLNNLGGDKFWVNDKGKGLTHSQFYREVGAVNIKKHVKL